MPTMCLLPVVTPLPQKGITTLTECCCFQTNTSLSCLTLLMYDTMTAFSCLEVDMYTRVCSYAHLHNTHILHLGGSWRPSFSSITASMNEGNHGLLMCPFLWSQQSTPVAKLRGQWLSIGGLIFQGMHLNCTAFQKQEQIQMVLTLNCAQS